MPVANSSARFLFDILALLGGSEVPMTLTAIRQGLDLPAATTHRGLATLEQAGFVERFQASTRYRLGPQARWLRQAFFARFEERDRVLPLLRRLSLATGQTASFSIRIGWFTAKVAAVTGPRSMVYTGPIGAIARLDDDGAGHALLLALPQQEQAAFAAYADRHGVPPRDAEAGFDAFRVLLDRLNRPAAVILLGETPTTRAVSSEDKRSTILDQLSAALSPIEHHYSHLPLDAPALLNQLERARMAFLLNDQAYRSD